jgi:type II secretory pathway pseudopilin PulG
MNMKKLAFMAAIALGFGVLAGLPNAAQALNLNPDPSDPQYLGSLVPPEPASGPDEEHYVNTLAQHAPGVFTDTWGGQTYTYTRTANSCGTCPTAVFNSKNESPIENKNGTTTVNLGTGGFTYLLAKYDGPNGADAVWNIQGLTGLVYIPFNAFGHDISHWSLFGGGGQGVPDGGTTVMLLGAALGTLGVVRRFLTK